MAEGNIELARMGSLCTPDPQTQLMNAWKSKDFDTFYKLLKQPDVSTDHWYGDPVNATLLYLACKDNAVEYVRALLNAKAEPNNLNQLRYKAPIHIAAENAEYEVLEALVEDKRTDVNIRDTFGDTPLHVIAKQKLKGQSEDTVSKYIRCIQLLMRNKEIKVNVSNKKGYTPVHYAAMNGTEQVVKTILKCAGDDLDIDTSKAGLYEKSARETILENFPELAELLPEQGRPGNKKDTVDSSALFKYLYERDFDSFIAGINVVAREELDKSDGSSTLLQYCAKEGLETPARALLNHDVHPNATCLADTRPPALLACYSGQPAILNLFFQKHGPQSVDLKDGSDARETALLAILKSPRADTSAIHTDYRGCLDLLLEHLPHLQIDVNAADYKGNTALHYAAKNDDDYAVLSLLKHGAYVGIRNVLGEPPLASMSPKMLETFLNGCLDTNGEFPREDTYEVTFSYKFLVPPPREGLIQQQQNPSEQVALPLNDCDSPREPLAHQNIATTRINTETEPLLYISQSRDLRYLLKHPIFTSFLDLKWQRICAFFYINLIFYILFVVVLTCYILLWYGKSHIVDPHKDSVNTSIISSDVIEESATETFTLFKYNASGFWWAVLIVFLALLTVRELFQLVVFSSEYFKDPENYLEFIVLITSAAILFSDWVHGHARPHFSAVAILLSWAELVLLIGRHPSLSVNIEMFKRVSWNFLKFLAWYAILIVAFAISFYALFRDCGAATQCGEVGDSDENFFLDPGMSVFKTVVMLTGEFDVASIPFVSFPGTSHVVFILFIFLIAIVLFNLLNGLAVSDTQAIRDDAEIVSYMSRVRLMSYIEALYHSPSLLFVSTLRRICCCSPTVGQSLKPISSRIYLFPYKVPDNVIRVLPNRGSRIMFCSHQKKRKEIEEKATDCCPLGCGSYTLDSEILKKAMEIINNRHKVSDLEEIKTKLKETEVKLEIILDYIRQLDSSSRK